LEIVDPGPILVVVRQHNLDAGEEAALNWALHHPRSIAIIADRRGRRAARALGIPVIGVLGLIADAKLRGVITAARPVVDHLLGATDWRISAGVDRAGTHG
jgi:uncharacterized protein